MLGGRHVAEKRRAVGGGGRRADRAYDVVVAGRDVGNHRPQHVKRRALAGRLLAFHVHLDLVERHVSGPLHHHLHAARAATVHELAKDVQLAELRRVRGVSQAARAHSVAKRHGHVVRRQDVHHLVPMRVERVLGLVLHHPFGHDGTAAAHDAHLALHRGRNVLQHEPRVQRHEVDALLRLLADDVQQKRRIHVRDVSLQAADGLVDGHGAEGLGAGVEHPLPDRLHVLAHGKVHHEVGSGLERDRELLQLVALSGVRHAAPEVRVDLCREHPAHAHGAAVRVRGIERNDGRAVRHGRAHGLRGDVLFGRDGPHRVGHKTLPGRFKLSHGLSFEKGHKPFCRAMRVSAPYILRSFGFSILPVGLRGTGAKMILRGRL